jgi:hypothetical protein
MNPPKNCNNNGIASGTAIKIPLKQILFQLICFYLNKCLADCDILLLMNTHENYSEINVRKLNIRPFSS